MPFFVRKLEESQDKSQGSQKAHNIKNGTPSKGIRNPAGKGRTEGRCKSGGESYNSHNGAAFFRPVQAECHYLGKGKKNSGSQSLDDTGKQQKIDIGRKCGCGTADEEQEYGGQV